MGATVRRARVMQYLIWHEAEYGEPATIHGVRRALGCSVGQVADTLADLARDGAIGKARGRQVGRVEA